MNPAADTPPAIPDHELLRPIGSGNYGTVWLGRNVLGTLRAIKVVHRSSFMGQRPYDREYAGIMKYEPLSRGHPGLVAVLHVGRNTTAQYFYYIMELADDAQHARNFQAARYEPRTLQHDLARHIRLSVPECLRVGLCLASALGHLHRHGVVHRDIKPSNIIFVDNDPKFADIGLVEDIGETNTFVGSEGYTPPEGPGKPTADLYGLGKVLYEISTGLDQLKFPELPTGFAELPDAASRTRLFELTHKACEVNPRRRFQHAQEMIQALQQLESSLTGTAPAPGAAPPAKPAPTAAQPRRLVVVGDITTGHLPALAALLEAKALGPDTEVILDRPGATTVEWARRIESEIARADLVVALLTPASLSSEMLAYELQLAQAEAQQHGGRPCIQPILIDLPEPAPPQLAELLGPARTCTWPNPQDAQAGLQLIQQALGGLKTSMRVQEPLRLREPGGAVPLDSPLYLVRPADAEFHQALADRASIVLIKGARQMGKTSLLARGLQQARQQGSRVAHTDYQQFNAASLESLEKFYFALGNSLADSLDLDVVPEDVWDSRRSPNSNLERFIRREVLGRIPGHLVWGMDEIDRLLPTRFGTDVFGLFRSWHNQRALEPDAPWSRLTLAMVYATEGHLLITDVNQSPFNVGIQVFLEDFSADQLGELNRLHGSPLRGPADRQRLHELAGGQPFLLCRCLHELAKGTQSLEQLEAEAARVDGLFSDHLRRIVFLVAKDPTLVEALQAVLRGDPCPSLECFHRLRAAGILVGTSAADALPRCRLYREYLRRNL